MIGWMRRVRRDERGVAMITVLLIGASLAALVSTAAFVTIEEMRTGADDQKSAESLAYAEAGVDRMILELRRGSIDYGDMRRSGCPGHPTVTLSGGVGGGGGTFDARLEVFPLTASECNARATAPLPRPTGAPARFAIVSTGRQPTARRVVRQIIGIRATGLPIGIYADSVSTNGTPALNGISLFTPGDVNGREKLGLAGNDAFYKLSDLWPSLSATTAMPASVHAAGAVYCNNLGGAICTATGQEHAASSSLPLNCEANNARGGQGQSQWDQSGAGGAIPAGSSSCSGQTLTPPPTSFITRDDLRRVVPNPDLSDQDIFTLRDAAQQTGLYCHISASGTQTCTRGGASWTPSGTTTGTRVTIANGTLGSTPALPQKFVAFFDFAQLHSDNEVAWGDSWPSTTPMCNPDPAERRSVMIVIMNGSFGAEGTTQVNGALFAPQGDIRVRGTFRFNGTVRALRFNDVGTAQFSLDDCWVNNMPGPFLDVTPLRWSELDR